MATVRRLSVATLFGLLCVLVAFGSSEAQLPAANAEAKVVRGRAELLRKGQTTWATLAPGTRVAEGDQVRTFPGASIEFALPDGSSTLVAENTRYVVTKLQYNAQTRERNFGFHVVVGKVKADVSRAAVEAVRARQANFFISSPNGVAAVRGTVVIFVFNPATNQTLLAVLPSPGQTTPAIATFISLATGTVTTVTGGNFVTLVGGSPPSAPAPIKNLPLAVQQALLTAANGATAGSILLLAVDFPPPPPPPPILTGDPAAGGPTEVTPPPPPPPPPIT